MRWLLVLLLLLMIEFVTAALHLVMKGQITYDAEGNDISNSKFFSREIHWPGNSLSGVTIGRGYDLGFRSRATIEEELTAAGIHPKTIAQLKKGAGLKGKKAKAFVKRNKKLIADISHEQQVKLFNYIYPKYEARAERNYNKWTKEFDDRVAWEDLHPPIRDVLVDFVYQGFTKGPNPMKAGMNNNFDELIRYIESTKEIRQYELGRNRADYLKENREAIEQAMNDKVAASEAAAVKRKENEDSEQKAAKKDSDPKETEEKPSGAELNNEAELSNEADSETDPESSKESNSADQPNDAHEGMNQDNLEEEEINFGGQLEPSKSSDPVVQPSASQNQVEDQANHENGIEGKENDEKGIDSEKGNAAKAEQTKAELEQEQTQQTQQGDKESNDDNKGSTKQSTKEEETNEDEGFLDSLLDKFKLD